MSMLDDIKAKLVAQGVSTTITISRVLDTNQDAETLIALFQYTGPDPTRVPEQSIPKYEYPRLQILCRSVKDQDAESLAYRCFREVTQIINETINGHVYQSVSASGSPFELMRDEEDRSIWACNYRVFREVEIP